MSDSLRRSTRRNNHHNRKRDGYSPGDVIELTRAVGFAHGRLVKLLSDDPANAWLVTFDDQDLPDEEIHEDNLGPVIARVDDSDNGGSKSGDKSKGSKKKSLRTTKPTLLAKPTEAKVGSGSDDAESLDSSNKKKRRSESIDLQPDDHLSTVDTDVSSPNDSSKQGGVGGRSKVVSDREQRSRRRQQTIEEVPESGFLKVDHPGLGLAGPPLPLSKKVKTQGGEAVVKIPMLTGTLFLYRGAKRRVAFVRKL